MVPQGEQMKKRLWQCGTFDEQKRWCLSQLLAGKTLTEHGIWLGGAEPDRIVESLRRDGVRIKTCYVSCTDANDTVHQDMVAWKIM